MEQRKYSVAEIDRLREVVEDRWLFGDAPRARGITISRSHTESEKTACVEEIVRTHMIAGHTAEDLLATSPPPSA